MVQFSVFFPFSYEVVPYLSIQEARKEGLAGQDYMRAKIAHSKQVKVVADEQADRCVEEQMAVIRSIVPDAVLIQNRWGHGGMAASPKEGNRFHTSIHIDVECEMLSEEQRTALIAQFGKISPSFRDDILARFGDNDFSRKVLDPRLAQ